MPDVVPSPAAEKLARQTWLSHVGDQAAFNRDLAKILADAAKEGERIILSTIGDGVGAEIRRAQYKIAAAQLQQLSTQMWAGQIDPLITSHVALSTDRAVDGLMAIDRVLAASLANSVLRESFLAAARNGADNVRSRLLNNIRLAPSVYGTQTMADTWVAREVNRGIALNKSAKEIANSVRKFIDPRVRGGVSYAAQRLGRTELNNAFHTTTIRAAADQPWITGFLWHTSGSHPEPDECDSFASDDHDGLGPGIFSKGNAPGKPHPQCLCYITTISVPDEEFHNSLLAGKYDKFLERNGASDFSGAVERSLPPIGERPIKVLGKEHDIWEDDWRSNPDEKERATALWQWQYDSNQHIRQIESNIRHGLNPQLGVKITDQQRAMWSGVEGKWGLQRFVPDVDSVVLMSDDDILNELVLAAKNLGKRLDTAKAAKHPLFRGMRIPKEFAGRYKIGETIDLDMTSFSRSFEEAVDYSKSMVSGRDDIAVYVRLEPGAKTLNLKSTQTGMMKPSSEEIFRGNVEITEVVRNDKNITITVREIR